jgi:hypothetical protein
MAIILAGALLVVLSLVFAGSYTSLLAAGIGGALLVVGGLFVVPLVLSRLSHRLATLRAAPRMGVRDATRARTRSGPAVAAVVVVVAALTMITISASSDDAQARRDYAPATLPGPGSWKRTGRCRRRSIRSAVSTRPGPFSRRDRSGPTTEPGTRSG